LLPSGSRPRQLDGKRPSLPLGQNALRLPGRRERSRLRGHVACTSRRGQFDSRAFTWTDIRVELPKIPARGRRSNITCVSDPTAPPTAAFNFTDFARQVYSENPDIYVEPLRIEENFLLPALYGGEAGHGETSGKFKALVVLQDPLLSFTKKLWTTQCATPEEAINRHRKIFFQWAFSKPEPAALFRGLAGEPSTAEDFFRRLYITDVWKDAAFRGNLKPGNPGYESYWRSKLQIELSGVATERVIFVGGEARHAGWGHVPPGTHRDCIVFPSRRNKTFRAELQRLIAKIHGEPLSEDLSNGPTELQLKEDEAGGGSAAMDHNWTLNDENNHNHFGVIPINQPQIQMNLSYKRSRNANTVPVASVPLDMSDLLTNNLVREVENGGKRGFWLRFVHDLANNGIYIQLNQHYPSRFVAKVPAGAL
jgi:hypothetical protein